jgi:hypothetical protein
MNNQEIIDNAPEGATHIGPWVYKVSGKNIPLENGLRNHNQEGLRSLADIKRIVELEQGYEELRIAALYAVCKISGGQAKADLRDAYDKATEHLETLKSLNSD